MSITVKKLVDSPPYNEPPMHRWVMVYSSVHLLLIVFCGRVINLRRPREGRLDERKNSNEEREVQKAMREEEPIGGNSYRDGVDVLT